MKKNKYSGFTLLELLIVVSIVAILSVALVIVLNPAETLRKARDAQRISDLSTLKTAIGLYMTSVSPVFLGGTADNNFCKTTPATTWSGAMRVSYSLPSGTAITDSTIDGGAVAVRQAATPALTDATGWIPINFGNIAGGSPISNAPVDPTNTVTVLSAVANTDLVYRYGCSITPLAYEIDSQLESSAYTTAPNDLRASDGGNNASYYETGTNLAILGTGTDF